MDEFIRYSGAHWSAYLGEHSLPPKHGDPALPTDVAQARALNEDFDFEVFTLSHYDDGVACCGGDA